MARMYISTYSYSEATDPGLVGEGGGDDGARVLVVVQLHAVQHLPRHAMVSFA
jgi:hypothetical protein